MKSMKSSMESLLRNNYHRYFGLQRATVSLESSIVSGDVSLKDNTACRQCRDVCEEAAVFKMSSKVDVLMVNVEKYFEQFNGTRAAILGPRCDALLCDKDQDRIMFLEMTCKRVLVEKDNQTLDTKRQNARNQLSNSRKQFMKVPEIAEFIEGFKQKTEVFAYRKRMLSKNVRRLAGGFVAPIDLVDSRISFLETDDEFLVYNVPYPLKFEW